MNNIDIIRECFDAPGFSLLPKNDGRVEVPQKIIKMMDRWSNGSEIYVFGATTTIVLSPNRNASSASLLGKISPSGGRVRLPVSFIRKVGAEGKELVASMDGKDGLVLRPKWDAGLLSNYIALIPNDLAEAIAKILRQEFVSGLPDGPAQEKIQNKTKFATVFDKKIRRDYIQYYDHGYDSQPVCKSRLAIHFLEDQPVLILPSIKDPIIFRPVINGGYRFDGYWLSSGELVLKNHNLKVGKGTENFYIIPGFKRLGNNDTVIGWLLVSEIVYGSIANKTLKRNGGDLILWYDPCVREEIRVFINPPDNSVSDIEVKALSLCNDSDSFIKSCFRRLDKKDIPSITYSPITISSLHIEVYSG